MFLGAFLVVVVVGCHNTKFDQTHYVGVVNPKTKALQFFRFELHGRPGLTSTQFVSGWYPEAALDKLVGEEIDVFDLTSADREGDGKGNKDDSEKSYLVTGPEGQSKKLKDKRLAIIMASDPAPITNAIAKLAKSKELEDLLENLGKKAGDEDKRQRKRLKKFCEFFAKSGADDKQKEALKAICDLLLPSDEPNDTVKDPGSQNS